MQRRPPSAALLGPSVPALTLNTASLPPIRDTHGGYSGNALIWGKASQMAGLGAGKPGWSFDNINKQIDAGRPVAVGVDYRAGSNGGPNGTDHWIAVTHRKGDTYFANDPATGKEIALKREGNRLVGGPSNYETTGELVTFSGGNPRPGTAPAGGGTSTGGTPPNAAWPTARPTTGAPSTS